MECYPQNGKRYLETKHVDLLRKSWVVPVELEWAWLHHSEQILWNLEATAVMYGASPQHAGAGVGADLDRWTREQLNTQGWACLTDEAESKWIHRDGPISPSNTRTTSWRFVNPFSEYLLSTWYTPWTMLGSWDISVNRTPCLYVAYGLKILVNLIPKTKKRETTRVPSLVFSQNHL